MIGNEGMRKVDQKRIVEDWEEEQRKGRNREEGREGE